MQIKVYMYPRAYIDIRGRKLHAANLFEARVFLNKTCYGSLYRTLLLPYT